VQTYLAFFFPLATAGISGNLYFHCQSDKTGKKRKKKNCKEDAGMIKVKHVIHLAHSFEQVLDKFLFIYVFLPLKVSMLHECIIHLAHIVVKKCDTWFLGFFFPLLVSILH